MAITLWAWPKLCSLLYSAFQLVCRLIKFGARHKPKYWLYQSQNGNQAHLAPPLKPGICKPMGDSTMASPISTHSQWFRHIDAHWWSQLIALSLSEHCVYICQLSPSFQTLRSHLIVEQNILVWTLRRFHCLLWRGCHFGRLWLVGWFERMWSWRGCQWQWSPSQTSNAATLQTSNTKTSCCFSNDKSQDAPNVNTGQMFWRNVFQSLWQCRENGARSIIPQKNG